MYPMKEESISAFAAYLHREERSQATMEKYLREVQRFARWLGDRPVTKEAVAAWKETLCQIHSAGTVNGSLAALHSFFTFMGWQDCRVKYLKVQRRLFRDGSRDLEKAEYLRLVEAARREKKPRLALLLETICATGIRVSEVRYITVEAARQGRADISLKGKVRTILIPGKLARKLLKYAGKQKNASGEIFLTASGRGISRCQIWAQMKALCQAAGVAKTKVFPHNLRHVFAKAFYKATRDIVKLADILRHSSIDTTRIYLITTGTEHAKHMEKLGFIL